MHLKFAGTFIPTEESLGPPKKVFFKVFSDFGINLEFLQHVKVGKILASSHSQRFTTEVLVSPPRFTEISEQQQQQTSLCFLRKEAWCVCVCVCASCRPAYIVSGDEIKLFRELKLIFRVHCSE